MRATNPDSVGRCGHLDDPGEERFRLRKQGESLRHVGGVFFGKQPFFLFICFRCRHVDIFCLRVELVFIKSRMKPSSPPAGFPPGKLIIWTNDTHFLYTKKEGKGSDKEQISLHTGKTKMSVCFPV